MRNNQTPRFYIVSAYQIENDREQNEADHADICCDIAAEDYPSREVEGYFKGAYEDCILVIGNADAVVKDLAECYSQNSYLVVTENDRAAYSVDVKTGVHTHLGKWVSVGRELPKAGDWTCSDGEYYQVTGRTGPSLERGL